MGRRDTTTGLKSGVVWFLGLGRGWGSGLEDAARCDIVQSTVQKYKDVMVINDHDDASKPVLIIPLLFISSITAGNVPVPESTAASSGLAPRPGSTAMYRDRD